MPRKYQLPKFISQRIDSFYRRHPKYKDSFGVKRFDLVGLKSIRQSFPKKHSDAIIQKIDKSFAKSALESYLDSFDMCDDISHNGAINISILHQIANGTGSTFTIKDNDLIFDADLKIGDWKVATSGKKFTSLLDVYDRSSFKDVIKRLSSLKIVLNLAPDKAIWDLATMSMRGPESCMSWDREDFVTDGSHCVKLTGSMLDPVCAIIYLTDGTKTKYGEKIIARSVIRIVVDDNNRKHIFVEKVYVDELTFEAISDDDEFYGLSQLIREQFVNFLRQKTNYPVISSGPSNTFNIVGSDVISDLKAFDPSWISYVDSGLSYQKNHTIKTSSEPKTVQKIAAKKSIKPTIKKVNKKK